MKLQIKHKLFFTLLLTSIAVSSGMFFFMQWSLDRGFINYVNSQKAEELNLLSAKLVERYNKHGNWQFLQNNNQLWRQLIITSNPDLEDPRRQEPHSRFRPPPPARPHNLEHKFALFSAAKKPIFAPPTETSTLQLTPIEKQGEVIGYLALVPIKELSAPGDLLFVEQQTESIALIALAMALLSLLLSYLLTTHLLRPIKALTTATRKLIAGQFKTRITVTTKDELGQLSNDFNHLAISLENNQTARQQWVADISHELRTPLAILQGDIEALQDGIRQPGIKTFAALHSETLHLSRLVDDLYELSMSDIGALNYKKIGVNPVGILTSSIDLFQQRLTEQNLQLHTNFTVANPITILGDPDRLQQLFSNLLENSLRYTAAPGNLHITVQADKHSVIFTFADSAPGVPTEQIPKLFDRLYRVEASRNRAKGGAGLGLTICHNIVTAHNGQISATASPHDGLEITIKFTLQG